jgi:hypothetical protein
MAVAVLADLDEKDRQRLLVALMTCLVRGLSTMRCMSTMIGHVQTHLELLRRPLWSMLSISGLGEIVIVDGRVEWRYMPHVYAGERAAVVVEVLDEVLHPGIPDIVAAYLGNDVTRGTPMLPGFVIEDNVMCSF